MKSANVWRLTLLALIICGISVFGQEQSQMNPRAWSKVYWQKMAEKGLVPVNPQVTVKPGQFTGSQINALSSLVDDSPDVLVIGGNNTQSENSIFANPNDPSKVLNSNNSTDWPVSGVFGSSGFMSDDNGLTWNGSIQGTGGGNSGDPAAVIGLNGEYYVGYIAADGGQGVAYSTDEGATWTHVQCGAAPAGFFDLLDKNHLWIDNSPVSPHEGNLYAAWTRFESGSANNEQVEVVTSTDGGRTWSAPVGVTSALPGFKQGVNLKTASDGTVYAFYTVYTSGGVTDEPAIGMSVSTDGGVTWTSGVLIIDNIRGVRATGVDKSGIRSAAFPTAAVDISGGARDGNLYVAWPNIGVPGVNTGTDMDIYVISSSDGGATWNTPVRVNQDASGQGKKHFLPWITCDPVTGNLSMVFYDDRNVAATDVEVFAANSLDGGVTWEDFKISDVSFTPAPIPGLAGGYFGDYLGISAHAAKVYPVWTDNRDGIARAYVSAYVLADPTDPNGVSAGAAYSDFTTPNTIELTWTDPTTLVDGTPISSGDFTIEISRDGAPLTSVAGGTQAYTDNGLTDGLLYEYELITKLTLNDSLSLPVGLSWYAGGSPMPSAPQNLAVTADTVDADLTWDDPTTQSDGTPLDDLDSIRVYRNGAWIANVDPGVGTYTDTPPPGFTYTYTVKALDNETPANESAASNAVSIYVGSTPDYLVWVGADAGESAGASGDSIAAALAANGISSFVTNDLFEFGSNLDIYEGIFVVLGIFSNNHVIASGDAEGPALESFVQNGGWLYLEGGDCFNYDPEQGGYNIRPWFSLDDGADGSGDIASLTGINDLDGFVFPYSGENNFMDRLVPISSVPIWHNDATGFDHGVFNTGFGAGRTIAAVAEFGGMDNTSLSPAELLRKLEEKRAAMIVRENNVKPYVERTRNENFVKKFYPADKNAARNRSGFAKIDDGNVEILANNKADLMAAYLGLFSAVGGPPAIALSPDTLHISTPVNVTNDASFFISNDGGSLAQPLEYEIDLNTFSPWITSISPDSGTVGGAGTQEVVVAYDANGLVDSTYTAELTITSNDPATPTVLYTIQMTVSGGTPEFLVWVGVDAGTSAVASADSIGAALAANGRSAYVTDDLFFFGADLSVFDGVFVVLGIFTNNHVIDATDLEGPALEAYLQNGGRVYVEGGDCFNYDPEQGGYNIRPWFDLNDGPDGSANVAGLIGVNDLDGFVFTYSGANSFMDQLQLINSTAIWKNSVTDSTHGVFNAAFGTGRAIGVVAEFGGMDNSALSAAELLRQLENQRHASLTNEPVVKPYVERQRRDYTVGKYYRAQKKANAGNNVSYKNGDLEVLANNKVDLMAAYLNLFEKEASGPAISVEPTELADSLLVGETSRHFVDISNVGGSLAAPLDYTITISGLATWLTFDPSSGTVNANQTDVITVDLDATGLTAGDYFATLEVASNDTANPTINVNISLNVTDAPIASISPDSFDVTLAIGDTETDTLVITNDGPTALDYQIAVEFASAANMKVEVIGSAKNDNQKIIAKGKNLPLVALNQTQFAVAMNASGEPDFEAPSFAAGAGNENDPAPSIAGEEVFGSNASTFGPSGLRGRGNLFTVTSNTTLSEHRLYLNPTAATKMHFVVAESDAQVGTYTTISVAELTSAGPGEGWYSSGSVNVPLQAGKFYLIFAQWEGNANYYNQQGITPYPIQASFGELAAAAGWSTGSVPTYADPPATEHPIAATAFGEAVAYYQTLVTSSGSWLTPSITEGSVPANSSVEVLLTFDPAGLVGGDYEADVVVTSNDPANPELRAYAHMFVVGQALVSADPVVFANPVFVGGMDSTTMVVRNEGNGVLNVTDVASDNAVFSVSQTAFDVAAFDSAEVTVYFMPTAEGGASGTLTISSNDPANPTLAVAVSATAVIAPSFTIDPDSLGATLGLNDSTDAPMLIENSGGSPLSWAVSVILGKSKTVFPEMRGNASNAGEVDAVSNQTPGLAELNTPQRVTDDIWDLQFSHDITAVSGAAGNAGSEFDGQYYYTTRWASNLIHKYELDGGGNLVLVEEFSIAGVTGLRDLAYDGQYFYGGAAAGTIFQMDFDSKTLVGTIASPQPVRHIAYDSDLDAFYVGNWATNIVLVDRSGTVLNTLAVANHGGQAVYGSAYDNTSDGGPYLWLFDQTTTTTTVQGPNVIKQIALPSGVATGVEYDVVPDLGNGVDILLAGGLFISTDIVPGKVTIGGVSQSVPDGLFGYELGDAASGSAFMRITDFTSGVINPGDVGGFTVRLYSADVDTLYSAELEITTNDPLNASVIVPVTLAVGGVGVEEFETIPTTFAVSRNYPNPFNPTTSIDFQLPQVSNVKLVIYNVLGQQVRTLVNERMQPGKYKANWDGLNDKGASVASGIYIYRFEAGDFNSIQKMILLK